MQRNAFWPAILALALAFAPLLSPADAAPPAGAQNMSAKLPSARDGTSVVWTGSLAYVFGGGTSTSALSDVVKYDPVSDSATAITPLPKAVRLASAVWTGTAAYIFGGASSTGFGGGGRDIVKFDPATESATTMTGKMPSGISDAAAVWTGTAAYIFGGMDANGNVLGRIVRYDPAADLAETVSASIPNGLMDHAVAWDGRYAYLFGGLTSSFAGNTNIFRFDPATNALVTMNGALSFPFNTGAAVYDGKDVYLLGGARNQQYDGSDTVIRYSVAGDSTSSYSTLLATPASSPSAVWAGDAAYLFGGRDGNTRLSTIQRFVPGESSGGAPPVGGGGGGDSTGVPVNIKGSVVGPGGTGVVGIPVILLALAAGVLLPVGGVVTGSDGAYDVPYASSQPTHVAIYQDGHLQLKSIDSGASSQAPLEVKRTGKPVSADEIQALRGAVDEIRVFPVGTATSGSPATVDTAGYHGIQRVEIDASGVGLELLVVKMKAKGLDQIPEPPGEVTRWFGLQLVDQSTGSEVPVNNANLYFTAPPGVTGNGTVNLYHLLVRDDDTAWETVKNLAPKDGSYGVGLSSLSLFGAGSAKAATKVDPRIMLAVGGVLAVAVGGVATRQVLKKRTRSSGAPAARLERPAVMPSSGVELKEKEFLISGLRFEAGGKKLLQDVAFGFHQGQILALLGPSGSGKSTLLKCIIGENSYDGEVNVFGYRPGRDTGALKRLVGYVPQETQLYPDMTVKENIAYFGKQYGMPKAQLDTVVPFLIQTLGLEERTDTLVKVLSGGQQRRASIAATLVASPALLILDEPTSGLDPITRRNLWKFIRQANRELGVSVIVTTHFLDETEYSDRVVILVRGKVVAAGGPQELLRSLPGGGKVVVVELQNTSPQIEKRIREATQPLEKQGLVKKVDITGFTVRFFVENPQAANRSLLEALTSAEVPVKSLTAEDCKMEDVFIHYAGEPWKESGA